MIFKKPREFDVVLYPDQRGILLIPNILQDLNLHLKSFGNHLYSSFASPGANTKHLVVCFLYARP